MADLRNKAYKVLMQISCFIQPPKMVLFSYIPPTLEMVFTDTCWSQWKMKDIFLLEIMYFVTIHTILGINKSQGASLGYTQPIRW